MPAEGIDVLIIGAGQAGLAIARNIQSKQLSFRIIERNKRVGDSWRKRYESLILFTPREFSSLPGFKMEGEASGFPARNEIADYLERYSQQNSLTITSDTNLEKLSLNTDGSYSAMTCTGEIIIAKVVVIATGAFQQPIIPAIAKGFSPEVLQLNADTYRSPEQITGKSVLVVGDGATGRQIALELATKSSVVLATGHPRRLLPDRIFGKSIFWWLKVTGLIKAGAKSFIGRKIRTADAFPGQHLKLSLLEKANIRIVSKLANANGNQASFSAGQTAFVDTVIWALGYRDETEWLAIPNAKDAKDQFIHDRGVSPVKGLYYIGRHWQTSRGSSLLLGAADDAKIIAQDIIIFLKNKPRI